MGFGLFLVVVVLVAGRPSIASQAAAASSILIVIIHATLAMGRRDGLVFLIIVLLVTFSIENIGVASGLPFGRYHFVVGADLPHVGTIPLIVGFLYFGMGYPAWIISGLLLNAPDHRPADLFNLVSRPLVATFVMVQWDAVMDPSNATAGGLWVWHDGGGYFGVPLSNYVGWFLTVWTMFAAFAFYCAATRPPAISAKPTWFWMVPVALYLAAALCVVPPLLSSNDAIVRDGSGYPWRLHDIRESGVVVMVSTMLATAVLASLRCWSLVRQKRRLS